MAAYRGWQNNGNALLGRPAKLRAAPICPTLLPTTSFVIVTASTSEEAGGVFKRGFLYKLRSVTQNQAKGDKATAIAADLG